MSQCPTCGFDAPLATCLLCRGREVLRESRRAELRAHLDRGLTPRPRWWRPGDPEWLPVNTRTWRDFEGSEGVQESRSTNEKGAPFDEWLPGLVTTFCHSCGVGRSLLGHWYHLPGCAEVASGTTNGDKLDP